MYIHSVSGIYCGYQNCTKISYSDKILIKKPFVSHRLTGRYREVFGWMDDLYLDMTKIKLQVCGVVYIK